jgi:hypothetical protein
VTLPPYVGDMAERIAIMLIERYLERMIRKFGRVATGAIDQWAANWLLARTTLPRDLALALLEDLGRRTGARIEVRDDFGPPA